MAKAAAVKETKEEVPSNGTGRSVPYTFQVVIRVKGLLLASLPDDKEALEYVKEAQAYPRGPFSNEEGHAITAEELVPEGEEEVTQSKRRFRRREVDGKRALCVDEHMIQGLVKGAIYRGGFSGFPRAFVQGIFTRPRIIPLTNTAGIPFTEQDLKTEVRCFPGMTPLGMRNIRCEHEVLVDPMIRFQVVLLPGANETKAKAKAAINTPALAGRLKEVLEFASEFGGLGAGKRKSGLKYDYGIFEVEFPEEPNGTVPSPKLSEAEKCFAQSQAH